MRIVFSRKRLTMKMMRPAKWVLSSALTAALAAYGLDCVGMATPEPAMQRCNKMPYHTHHRRSHHGSQDCCSTAPQMRAALGQPSSIQGMTFSRVAFGVVQAFSDFQIVEFYSLLIASALARSTLLLQANPVSPYLVLPPVRCPATGDGVLRESGIFAGGKLWS